MFAAFRKTLLQHTDEQIVSIISNWMNRLIGDGFELLGPDGDGGPTEDKLDDFCELLGFHLVSNATGQSYASCKSVEAEDECRLGPSLYPQFLIELTEEISQ